MYSCMQNKKEENDILVDKIECYSNVSLSE